MANFTAPIRDAGRITAHRVDYTLIPAHRPFAISGQRPRNNNYMVDSVELNDADTGFIAGRATLTLAYVGTLGTRLPRARRPNGGENLPQSQRSDPTIGVLNRLETSALSNYHALQVKFTQRLGTHFDLRAAYTWSRFIDDVSDIPGRNQGLDRNLVPMDDNNLRRDRAVSDFDIPHVFSLSYLYRVPLLSRNRWLGGWSISGITTLQSGRPLTLYSGTDTPTGTNNNRINNIPGTLIRQPSSDLPIQLAAGATQQLRPAPGTFGSLGRNTERGDSFLNWNLSLIKDFRVTESSHFQIRGEIFNLFNTTNFNNIETVLTSPNFGRALDAFGPRRAQVAIRYVF